MNFVDDGSSLDGFGIDLKLNSIEAEEFYCQALRLWFENEKGYHTLQMTGREFILNDGFEDISIIYIHDSILRMRAVSEDPYETLVSMLEFIAEHHKKTIEVYDYLEENEQEMLSWPDSDLYGDDEEQSDFKEFIKAALDEDEKEADSESESEEDSDGWI